MQSLTVIGNGHNLCLAYATNLWFYELQFTVLVTKPKRISKPKNSVLR